MENHLYIENKITGHKEYILSFGESITIGKGSIIQGNVFKMFVSDKHEIKITDEFKNSASGSASYKDCILVSVSNKH